MQQRRVPRSVFEEILDKVKHGEPKAGLTLCTAALADYPNDINLLGLLGMAQGDLGQFEQAEATLRQVIELAPGFAKPYEDLGTLLVRQRKAEEAIPLLQKAVRLDPKLDAAHFHLGRALAAVGQGEEADAAFERSFKLSPLRGLMARAAEHHKAGRLQEAEKLCRKVLQKQPQHVDALRMLGLIAASSGEFDEAEHLLRQALANAPDHVPVLFELGRVLKELERYEDAIEIYREITERQPDNPKGFYRLGGALGPAALTEDSAVAYRRCLELAPQHTGAWLGLGHMLKTLGQQEAGIDAYRKCIALEPDFGEAYYSLANLKTFNFSDHEMEQMEKRLEDGSMRESSRVNFLFAMGKAYEDRKNFDAAWRCYSEGNEIQRMLVSYDPVHTETLNDELIDFFSGDFFSRVGEVGDESPAPIFILGMPRSGSTLVEQIIASHSQVEGTSELPYIGRLTKSLNRNRADGMRYPQVLAELEPRHFEHLGQEYLQLAQMHRVEGTPRFIDKMPNNFPSIGFIHTVLPNARIIDARRNPMDACVGNLRQLYARGQTFSYDQSDIGEYYLQYQRMMDHWDMVLPGKVLHVQYEDTVEDLDLQVRRILDFLELPFEQGCVDFHQTDRAVRTASSEQVRQPIYSSGVGYWRNYETHLGELVEILEPLLDSQ